MQQTVFRKSMLLLLSDGLALDDLGENFDQLDFRGSIAQAANLTSQDRRLLSAEPLSLL